MSRLKDCKKFASLFLSSLLFMTVLICLPAGAAEESSAATNFTAPDFELRNITGTNVSLSEFRGKKPVLLYFWATWCHYCKATRPEVIKMLKANPDGIEVLAINVGSGDSLDKVQRYEKADPAPYTVLYDSDSKVTRSYRVEGIPHFILLDKTGAVKYSGNRLPSDPMSLVK
jgi:thiol-disulfide isomerase/thioredoxin